MFGYVRMCVRLSADLSVAVAHVNHGHNAWHAYFTSLDATFAKTEKIQSAQNNFLVYLSTENTKAPST